MSVLPFPWNARGRTVTALVTVIFLALTALSAFNGESNDLAVRRSPSRASLNARGPGGVLLLSRLSARARAGSSMRKRGHNYLATLQQPFEPFTGSSPLTNYSAARAQSFTAASPRGRSPPAFLGL